MKGKTISHSDLELQVTLPPNLLSGSYVIGVWPAVAITLMDQNVGMPITVGVTVFELVGDARVVVCTELADNRGPSVTNSWPWLASALAEHLDLQPERTRFLEHYCHLSYEGGATMESFDLVHLAWHGTKAQMQGWSRLLFSAGQRGGGMAFTTEASEECKEGDAAWPKV